MNKLSCLVIAGIALGLNTVSSSSYATEGSVTGKIYSLEIKSPAKGGNNVQVNSNQTVGNCVADGSTGHIVAVIPDNDRGKAMISLLEAALLSGRVVSVSVDDNNATSGVYCNITVVRLETE